MSKEVILTPSEARNIELWNRDSDTELSQREIDFIKQNPKSKSLSKGNWPPTKWSQHKTVLKTFEKETQTVQFPKKIIVKEVPSNMEELKKKRDFSVKKLEATLEEGIKALGKSSTSTKAVCLSSQKNRK